MIGSRGVPISLVLWPAARKDGPEREVQALNFAEAAIALVGALLSGLLTIVFLLKAMAFPEAIT